MKISISNRFAIIMDDNERLAIKRNLPNKLEKIITNLDGEISIDSIGKDVINNNLCQALPPIDLLIKASNEYRVSNFMLWQLAYSEFYFTETLLPNFNKRNRRLGDAR